MDVIKHPSIPHWAKYKKAQLEQERVHGYQEDRNPMGTKKKLRANSAKKKQKPNWNLEESSVLATKKCNQIPIEAKNNTHLHTSMKATSWAESDLRENGGWVASLCSVLSCCKIFAVQSDC